MTSGFAFQALPALDVTHIDNSQHDRIISWYSNDLPFYTFTPSLSLEQFQVYNQMQKSKSLPCLPSLYYFQTSATCSAVVWELDIQAFHRSTAKVSPNDLGWFLLCFDCLYTAQPYLLQHSVFKKGLISPPLRGGELWKTIWLSKIIHWVSPRGDLSQTLSNPCFTRSATVSPSNSIVSLEILCKGRSIDMDIGTLSLKHEPWWYGYYSLLHGKVFPQPKMESCKKEHTCLQRPITLEHVNCFCQ